MVLTMGSSEGVERMEGCYGGEEFEGFITTSPSQLDPCNLLCMSDSGARAGKHEVKESSCCLPLEACGTSVGIGPSASTLIHLVMGRADDKWAMETVKEWT